MIAEHEHAILTEDVPDYGLKQGDIGTVVLVHKGGEAYEVEFMTLDGDTIAVITLLAVQVRPVAEGEIAHARSLAVA